jgi:hypothetical protein
MAAADESGWYREAFKLSPLLGARAFLFFREGGGCVESDLGDLVFWEPFVKVLTVFRGDMHGRPGYGTGIQAAKNKETT